MSRFTIRYENYAFHIIDTVRKERVDVAPTRSQAEAILEKWKRKYKES